MFTRYGVIFICGFLAEKSVLAGCFDWRKDLNSQYFLKVDQCQSHEHFWTARQSSQVINSVKTMPRLAENQIALGI